MKDEFKIQRKDIKIRKDWGSVSPETKIEKVKTDYKRSDKKRAIQEALDEMEQDNEYEG